MSEPVRHCVVIAAGRGSRLTSGGPPKPLFRLLGLPLIERAIVTAKRSGLENFIVVTGYDGLRIRKFLDRLAIRREITLTHVVNEDWNAGNGISVLKAREVIGAEPFVLLMADHLVDPGLLPELLASPLKEAVRTHHHRAHGQQQRRHRVRAKRALSVKRTCSWRIRSCRSRRRWWDCCHPF